MEEGASPPRWAVDKKLGEDASIEEKKEKREIEEKNSKKKMKKSKSYINVVSKKNI